MEKEKKLGEKELAIKLKEIESAIKLKENELAMKLVDCEVELKEKEIPFKIKEKELAIKLKEKEFEIMCKDQEINHLKQEIITTNSARKSLHVFEIVLMGAYSELELENDFNAITLFDQIVKCKRTVYNILSYKLNFSSIVAVVVKNSKDTKSTGYWTSILIDTAATCNLDVEELHDLYDVVSNKTHFMPWPGPDVQIKLREYKPEYRCFIEKMTKAVQRPVEKQ